MNHKIEESYCSADVHSLLIEKGCRIPIILQSIWITQTLAVEWVRVNFGYYIDSYVDDDQTYGYLITSFSDIGKHDKPLKRNFKTRKDAVDAALLYVLTNLK
jgi:hypothetical protein